MQQPSFHNYPVPLDRSVYDTATARYVSAVRSRASAVYQVGNVRYPGLSDIDLVVVVNRPAWDNNQFFSPFVRLTKPHRLLFHHEPRFIPESCLDAIAYGSCVHASVSQHADGKSSVFGSGRRLLFGDDVLGNRVVDVMSQSWLRCRVLETAFLFHCTVRGFDEESPIDVVKMLSRAGALRYPMRHLCDLLGMSRDRAYERAVDDARHLLLQERLPASLRQRAAADVYASFRNAARRFEANIRTLFDLRREEDLATAAADLLSGARPAIGIDAPYLSERHAAAKRFHEAQHHYRLSAGSIFATKPMNGARKPYVQPLAHRFASNARWRLGGPYFPTTTVRIGRGCDAHIR